MVFDIKIKEDGNLELINNSINFTTDNVAVVQRIVTMLNIRKGELIYNVEFGLDHKILWFTHADINQVKNHIRYKIDVFFRQYIKNINRIVADYDNSNNKRILKVGIDVTFKNNERVRFGGVAYG